MPVQIPDDSDFSSFKDQCLSADGWISRYSKGGVTVWCREEESRSVQKLKVSNRYPTPAGEREEARRGRKSEQKHGAFRVTKVHIWRYEVLTGQRPCLSVITSQRSDDT